MPKSIKTQLSSPSVCQSLISGPQAMCGASASGPPSDVKARYLRPLVLKCHRVQCLARGFLERNEGRTDGGREGRVTLFTLKMNFTASHISCPTKILRMVHVTSVARWAARTRARGRTATLRKDRSSTRARAYAVIT